MTDALIEAPIDSERVTLLREFPVELTPGDGRTLDLRIVPYNELGNAADPPDWMPYKEMFLPGVFERQVRAPDRVKAFLNFEHEQGIKGIIGHGLDLKDQSDGLHGSFRIHATTDGDKALHLVEEGILTGVSLEFSPGPSRRVNGVVQRVKATLQAVSLCRVGLAAYKSAQVLAVRTTDLAIHDLDTKMDEDLKTRLDALGFSPLTRIGVTRKPWDGAAARFTDEEYQRSCLVDRGGSTPVKERCSLPVLEPDGTLNTNALGAAAGRLNQLTDVSAAMKAAAARKLMSYYRMAAMTAPMSVMATAKN